VQIKIHAYTHSNICIHTRGNLTPVDFLDDLASSDQKEELNHWLGVVAPLYIPLMNSGMLLSEAISCDSNSGRGSSDSGIVLRVVIAVVWRQQTGVEKAGN
jgi:hypothetical protein